MKRDNGQGVADVAERLGFKESPFLNSVLVMVWNRNEYVVRTFLEKGGRFEETPDDSGYVLVVKEPQKDAYAKIFVKKKDVRKVGFKLLSVLNYFLENKNETSTCVATKEDVYNCTRKKDVIVLN